MSSYQNRQHQNRTEDQQLAAALAELGTDLRIPAEWTVVFSLLDGGWPGTVTKKEQLAYLTFLADVPPRTIARGLRELSRRGQKYRPTPSEVRQVLPPEPVPVVLTPEAVEAWQVIRAHVVDQLAHRGAARHWLDPVDAAGELNGLLYLVAEKTHVQLWVERRYLPLLDEAARHRTTYTGVRFTHTVTTSRGRSPLQAATDRAIDTVRQLREGR